MKVGVMSKDEIVQLMAYLGYCVRHEDGTLTENAFRTAGELAGKLTPNCLTASQIAEVWCKHDSGRVIRVCCADDYYAIRLIWRQRDLDGLIRTRAAWWAMSVPLQQWHDADRHARHKVDKGDWILGHVVYCPADRVV